MHVAGNILGLKLVAFLQPCGTYLYLRRLNPMLCKTIIESKYEKKGSIFFSKFH